MNIPTSGIPLLREVTRAEWLQQPRGFDFREFKRGRYNTTELLWKTGRPEGHEYDANARYLGIASSVQLGVGVPELVQGPEIADRAGAWLISARPGPLSPGPDLLPPLIKREQSWQFTPVVLALRRLGYLIEVHQAWLWPESHALLRPFYERVKALREATTSDEAGRAAVKRLYTTTFGMLAHDRPGHSASYIFRPDWWYTIVAESKARTVYRLSQVLGVDGVAASRVHYDCLYFPKAVTALPVGASIGQFKYHHTEA